MPRIPWYMKIIFSIVMIPTLLANAALGEWYNWAISAVLLAELTLMFLPARRRHQ